jgi:hypothetical protein
VRIRDVRVHHPLGTRSGSTDRGGKWKTIRRGAVGLALFGIAGWMWRNNNRPEGEAADQARDDETVDQQRP